MKRMTFLGILLSIIILAGVSYANSYNVDVDIRPQSCPNPFNLMNRGVVSVAILGSGDFEMHR